MTQPDRIPINPESTLGLDRWVEVDESEEGFMRVLLRGEPEPPQSIAELRFQKELQPHELARIQEELEQAYANQEYRTVTLGNSRVAIVKDGIRLSRRDWCALADWFAVKLWKEKVEMDDEIKEVNQAEADAAAGEAEARAAQEAEAGFSEE
jgi:hypothetical protein